VTESSHPSRKSLSLKAMDIVQKRLTETEEQIASAECQIALQRKTIAELEGNGHSADHAKYLLAGLELLQAARRDSRDALVKQLQP